MGGVQGPYPEDLASAVAHAKRLIKLLTRIERTRSDPWFVGRSAEVRGVVSLALADWRSGASDSDQTRHAIASYIDGLHRGASRKLRCGSALDCCTPDDAITAVGSEEEGFFPNANHTTGAGASQPTGLPTVRTGWVDRPEMLERFREGLALVETNARMVVRRVGEGCATMDDLRAFGREGLLDAARAFDERRGVAFDRWASLRIRSAMVDGVRRWGPIPPGVRRELRALERADGMSGLSHEPTALHGEATSDAAVSGEGPRSEPRTPDVGARRVESEGDLPSASGGTPEESVARAELAAVVRTMVAGLPRRERELLDRTYFRGQTLEQAAESMGVSPSWASRVQARAVETLGKQLRNHDRASFGGRGRGAAAKGSSK
jgi:RNA polymerase sigma factor for flagellar operon FliA